MRTCDQVRAEADAKRALALSSLTLAIPGLFGLPLTLPYLLVVGGLAAYAAYEGLKSADKWEEDQLKDCYPASPLALDLDGDGVEAGALAQFDHGGDGWAEVSRWADEGDGVLVWDRNGDGVINDGSELFGNNTVLADGENASHGFAALSELDSNGDGVVNTQDENFADLRVLRWTDANENGTKICFLM